MQLASLMIDSLERGFLFHHHARRPAGDPYARGNGVCVGIGSRLPRERVTRQSKRGSTPDRPIPRCVSNEISGDERPLDNS